MGVQVVVTIPNLNEIKAVFDQAPFKTVQEVNTAIQKSIFKIESNVKREAPVNKQSGGGQLRQSIRSEMTGMGSGKVEVGVDYGVYVEEGTSPHTISVRNAKVLADRNGNIFGKTVNHPGTKANPFFSRGVDNSRADIEGYFGQALENVFK